MQGDGTRRPWEWLQWGVRIGEPGREPTRTASVRLAAVTRPASFAARAIPPLLIVAGLVIAVLSATVVEDAVSEGVAALGVEVGAAMWFGGAIALSLRRTTVGRALLVVAAALCGLILIGLALGLGWTGAPLDLAMEFGVGAMAIGVIDVVVLGVLQPGLDALGRTDAGATVAIDFGWRWPPVTLHLDQVQPHT